MFPAPLARVLLAVATIGLLPSCCGIIPHSSAAKGAAKRSDLTKADFPNQPKTIQAGDPVLKNSPSGSYTWQYYETRPAGRNRAPLVVVLHELNGLSQGSLHLARELSSDPQGCHVILPVLFGGFGDGNRHVPLLTLFDRWYGWNVWSRDSMGPIKERTAALCRKLSAENGGAPLVVIGNCLSGSLALALLAEPCVSRVMACQPALPTLPVSEEGRRALALSEADWSAIKQALDAHPEKQAIGFRFLKDCISPGEKMEEIECRLGDRFQAYVLATADDRESVPPRAKWIEASVSNGHSTVTGLAKMKDTKGAKGRCEVLRIAREFIHGKAAR